MLPPDLSDDDIRWMASAFAACADRKLLRNMQRWLERQAVKPSKEISAERKQSALRMIFMLSVAVREAKFRK